MHCDVLVIGGGIGGCSCALRAADHGLRVLLLTNLSSLVEGSNTSYAQGGIIYRALEGDSPERLLGDIEAAGAGLVHRPAAEYLARRGPELVETFLLDRLAVPFDRRPDGALDITEEAAHSLPRILHAKDLTGRAISRCMAQAVEKHPNIRVVTRATAVDLLMLSHHSQEPLDVYKPLTCVGAYVLHQETGEVEPYLARETVLATGGLGQIYLHTTNPPVARGDGIAMAYRAGARIINLEYTQFHPTALYHPLAERFLISESLRGEGARLVDQHGREFMIEYHPRGSLAPRDVVARAIHEEMLRQDHPSMYLDITHKDADWIHGRFPNILRECLKYNIDITRQRIPVVPAAHYSCGGVAVDLEGRSTVFRLRAVGEVACTGAHGANRLASTSLLEALTWGVAAADSIAEASRNTTHNSDYLPEIAPWRYQREEVDPALIHQDWLTIKYAMWNYVGLARTTRRLNRALQFLRELQFEVEVFYRRAALTDPLVGLRNGLQTSLAVVYSAMANHTSRGCHYRIN